MRQKENGAYKCIQNFSRKSGGKRPLAQTRRRWEETITTDVKQVGFYRFRVRSTVFMNKVIYYLGFIREEVLVSNHENPYPVCIQLQLISLMFPFIIFKIIKTE